MTAPALIVILLFVEIPFVMSIAYSFTKWNGLDKAVKFIGIANYTELLTTDPGLGSAMIFTLVFTVLVVAATNVVALLFAVILDMNIRGKNVLRAAFYIPNIISLIIIGYVWRFIFSRGFDSFGALTHLGIFQLSWLGDPHLTFVSVVFVTVWQSIGFYMVIYIAGLQTVPREQLEAAVIDGAGPGDAVLPHHVAADPAVGDRRRLLLPVQRAEDLRRHLQPHLRRARDRHDEHRAGHLQDGVQRQPVRLRERKVRGAVPSHPRRDRLPAHRVQAAGGPGVSTARRPRGALAVTLVMTACALVYLYPLILVVINSMKTFSEITANVVALPTRLNGRTSSTPSR